MNDERSTDHHAQPSDPRLPCPGPCRGADGDAACLREGNRVDCQRAGRGAAGDSRRPRTGRHADDACFVGGQPVRLAGLARRTQASVSGGMPGLRPGEIEGRPPEDEHPHGVPSHLAGIVPEQSSVLICCCGSEGTGVGCIRPTPIFEWPGMSPCQAVRIRRMRIAPWAAAGNITLLHHAEHLANVPNKRIDRFRMPILQDGKRVWVEMEEYGGCSSSTRHAHAA